MSAATSQTTSNEVLAWLSSNAAYQPTPDRVEHLETHISHVFLAGPLVYKLKKPVHFDFLDFRSLAARQQACNDEVRLNSRLAPNVYLGVVPLTRDKHGLAIAGHGEVIDWLVQMHRLPLDQTLISLHRRGLLRPHHIQQLVRVMVAFYAGQSPLNIDESDYRQQYEERVRANRDDLLRNAPDMHALIKRVHTFQLQQLHIHAKRFNQRVQSKRIFDGHGDLRPEHICFSDPLAIFDCIEFNETFRQIDAADELSFLATECDFIGASWVGPLLLRYYSQLSGDHADPVLLDFYKAFRASVRAKVAALRAGQLHGAARAEAEAEVRAHLQLADRYAAPHYRPLIVIVGGLSGSGKSTLAASIAEALGMDHLRSDVVRRELYDCDSISHVANANVYDATSRQRVYDEMFQRVEAFRQQRLSVVVDATFASAQNVRHFREFSTRLPARVLFVECWCPPELARRRIVERARLGTDPSQATPQVYDLQQQQWDDWPADLRHCRVDTQQPLIAQRAQVFAALD